MACWGQSCKRLGHAAAVTAAVLSVERLSCVCRASPLGGKRFFRANLVIDIKIKVRPPMGGVSYSFAVAVPVPGAQGRGQERACWVHRAGALVLLRSSTRLGGCRHADVNPSRTIYHGHNQCGYRYLFNDPAAHVR